MNIRWQRVGLGYPGQTVAKVIIPKQGSMDGSCTKVVLGGSHEIGSLAWIEESTAFRITKQIAGSW